MFNKPKTAAFIVAAALAVLLSFALPIVNLLSGYRDRHSAPNRFYWRLPLLILVLLIFVPSMSVYADPIDFDMDGCKTYNFDLGQQGWTLPAVGSGTPQVRGVWADTKFSATTVGGGSFWSKAVYIRLAFDDTIINEVTMTYIATVGSSIGGVYTPNRRIRVLNSGAQVAFSGTDTLVGGGGSIGWTYEFDPVTADQIDVDISAGYATTSGAVTGAADILEVKVCGVDEDNPLVRPLAAQDEFTPWGMINQDWTGDVEEDKTILNFSKQPGAPVAAAVDGTIVAIENYSDDFKYQFIRPTSGRPILVPEDLSSQVGLFDYDLPYDFKGTVWVVALYNDELDQYFVYFVADAPKYIEVGMEVRANCYLGESIALSGQTISIDVGFSEAGPTGGITGSTIDAEPGVVVVTVLEPEQNPWDNPLNTFADAIDQFTIYPTTANACNVDPELADCIGDSALQYPEYWDTYRSVSWTDPGVQLGPQAYIKTLDTRPYNLDPERQPQIAVSARATVNPSTLRVGIGQTFQSFSITNVFKEYVIAGAAHEPTMGESFYQIFVGSESTNAIIEVEYICITFTYDEEGIPEPPPQPPSCYFANSSFDEGTASWTVSNPGTGVYTMSGRPGEILVEHEQTFYQTVALNPVDEETTQDYTVTIEAALYHVPAYDISPSNTTSTVEIEYDYDGAGYVTMGTFTYADYANADNVILYQDTLTVSAETDGTFVFRVKLVSQPADVLAVSIRYACIETGDGEPFPGYDDGEGTPDPTPPPFNADCEAIAPPAGDAVHHWLAWHWANLNAFFKCDLMVFLNQQYTTFVNFFRTVSWAIRYWIISFTMGIEWAEEQLLPWIAGYLSNAALGGTGIAEEEWDESGFFQGCAWWDIPCQVDSFLKKLSTTITNAFNSASNWIAERLNAAANSFSYWFNILYSWLIDLFDLLWSRFSAAINGVSWFLSELFNLIVMPLIQGALDFLRRIWDALLNIASLLSSGVTRAFGFILDIFRRILDFVLYAANRIIGMLLVVWWGITGLITAWNTATPQPLPGAPNCSVDPTGHVMCWLYWLLENTLFAGTWGQLIIPLAASILWILLIIWTVGQVLRLLRQAALVS